VERRKGGRKEGIKKRKDKEKDGKGSRERGRTE
jgi:hypothetical protein